MKLVTAIIQPQMLAEVIDAVVATGARGLTVDSAPRVRTGEHDDDAL
jgi:nitrogen regulatory protein PII